MSDMSAISIIGMEVPRQLLGKLSLGLRIHSDVIEGCVIRGNLGSKMGLIRKCAKISFHELEFKNQ